MPSRYLKEGLLTSDAFDRLTAEEESLWTRLLLVVDDFGRFDGRAVVVRSRCFPLKADLAAASVDRWMDGLAAAGMLLRYVVDGKPYVQMAKWTSVPRAKASKFPEPPANSPHPPTPPAPPQTPREQLYASAEQPQAGAEQAPTTRAQSCANAPVLRSSVVDHDHGTDEEQVPPVADAPGAKPDAPPVLTPDEPATPRRARKPKPEAPADPQLAPDRAAYLARYRVLFRSPEADFTRGQVFEFARLRAKHTMPVLLRALEGCGADPWTREHRTLAWVCSQEGVDFGTRPRTTGPNAPETRQFAAKFAGVEPSAEDLAAVERLYPTTPEAA